MDLELAKLKICIIGAGVGGLTTALALAQAGFEDVSIFEMASELGFVGAGIQLAPNMARILDRLGVWKQIAAEAVACRDTSIRDGATDTELGHVELDYIEKIYGYQHMVGHRASLVDALYGACKQQPAIRFHFSTKIQGLKSFAPQPTFIAAPRGGSPYEVSADVLLAADGVKSATRESLFAALGVQDSVQDTGQAAYRIMLTRDQMRHDPELLSLIETDRVTRWIGAKRHIIAYPISNHSIYNLSTTQPDVNFAAATTATYTTKGSKSSMLQVFGDFCPKVLRMLELVPDGEVCEWKLRGHRPLPTWVVGSVALIGDACHPTLPHLAQGAAQAIEDGAVLGVCLSALKETTPGAIHKALQKYEKIRKPRAETLVDMAAASGREMHLGEGAAKEERDRQFAKLRESGGKGKVPDKWADQDVQALIYGTDSVALAMKA